MGQFGNFLCGNIKECSGKLSPCPSMQLGSCFVWMSRIVPCPGSSPTVSDAASDRSDSRCRELRHGTWLANQVSWPDGTAAFAKFVIFKRGSPGLATNSLANASSNSHTTSLPCSGQEYINGEKRIQGRRRLRPGSSDMLLSTSLKHWALKQHSRRRSLWRQKYWGGCRCDR
jgi:hypothetical protein